MMEKTLRSISAFALVVGGLASAFAAWRYFPWMRDWFKAFNPLIWIVLATLGAGVMSWTLTGLVLAILRRTKLMKYHAIDLQRYKLELPNEYTERLNLAQAQSRLAADKISQKVEYLKSH